MAPFRPQSCAPTCGRGQRTCRPRQRRRRRPHDLPAVHAPEPFSRQSAAWLVGIQRRHISLETPIGLEGEDSLTLGMLATSRRYTAEHMEDHVDAVKIAEAAATLGGRDSAIFTSLAEGVAAEALAEEFSLTPAEARIERSRVIRRVKLVKRYV